MVVIQQEFASASIALGVDVFSLEPFSAHATAKRARKVKRVGIVGSTALLDTKFNLMYGSRDQAINLYNTPIGLTNDEEHMIPIVSSDYCAVDEKILLVCTDAAADVVNIKVEIV